MPINSAVDKTPSGGFTNQVASITSNGMTGCAPVSIKNGEHPLFFFTVILSAQNIWCKNQYHFGKSPPVALVRPCLRSQWPLSIRPFALELYGDICIPFIPYFCSIQATAALKVGALSVTILLRQPHLQLCLRTTTDQVHEPLLISRLLLR